jgi:uncharacterized metal-binding protein YceD (DUF177 family)
VNALRQYDIAIQGLDNKRYLYDFVAEDSFFAAMEQDLIRHGSVNAHLALEKSETMIRLDFAITGTVEQVCDRSLDEYDEQVETERTMLLKFANHNEELTDEIELIERNTPIVNVARYIFEFIALDLPMKRLHPRFRDEEDEEDDGVVGRLIYQSDPNTISADDDETNTTNPDLADPRWAMLRKLNDN